MPAKQKMEWRVASQGIVDRGMRNAVICESERQNTVAHVYASDDQEFGRRVRLIVNALEMFRVLCKCVTTSTDAATRQHRILDKVDPDGSLRRMIEKGA